MPDTGILPFSRTWADYTGVYSSSFDPILFFTAALKIRRANPSNDKLIWSGIKKKEIKHFSGEEGFTPNLLTAVFLIDIGLMR